MPELPEIETIRQSLKGLAGKNIERLRFSKLAPIETTSAKALRQAIENSNIAQLARRGKYLLIQTDKGATLVIHLGMSGHLRYFNGKNRPQKNHTHMEIDFKDGTVLTYVDARRFGTLSLSQDPSHTDNPFLSRLGPDYDDPNLSPKEFIARCRRHPGIGLKTLTLNQGIAAGLGNIYACESLYRAQLDPRRLVNKTSDEQLTQILKGARQVLKLGIHHGGVSMRDYLDGNGHRGVMKEFLQVYDREGKPTLDGRGQVKRIVQNARSTWFCPKIQV